MRKTKHKHGSRRNTVAREEIHTVIRCDESFPRRAGGLREVPITISGVVLAKKGGEGDIAGGHSRGCTGP